MLPVLLLLNLALLLWLIVPRLLVAGTWRVRHPVAVLRLWFLALASGVGALVATVVLLVDDALSLTPFAEMPGVPIGRSVVVAMLAWFALALVGGALALVVGVVEQRWREDRRVRDELSRLAALGRPLTFSDPAADAVIGALRPGAPVTVVADDALSAVALPGSGGRVLVGERVVEELEPGELAAVIAHERAHLRRRHHLLIGIAELHAACLPGSPAGRDLRRATRLLVELIADDDAAREVGAPIVAAALRRIGSSGPVRSEARDAVLLRSERLERRLSARSSSRR